MKRSFFAPGRVNLIGEHTDYNDGFVLPMAIDRGTTATSTQNDSDAVRVRSYELDDVIEVPIDVPFRKVGTWADYAGAVIAAVQEEHPLPSGLDIDIRSDVPLGGGLSSSASFELALAQALFAHAGIEPTPERLADVGRRAEVEFVGIRSGVMDQLAVAHGVAGSALFIDCRTLAFTPIAMPAGVAVVVMDTGVKHALATSAYNERRGECERAVELLRARGVAIESLRDLEVADFERVAADLPSPLRERATHVVNENARTKAAVAALAQGDAGAFGRLMDESHESLRDYYDVSIEELDALVAIARDVNGVYGARMTGGGFGGCAIALVDERAASDLIDRVTSRYYGVRNMEPAAFVTLPSAGAHSIS